MSEKVCAKCKRKFPLEMFAENYVTCFSCRESRKKVNNYCKICGIRASFNFEGEKLGVRCAAHKEPGMINIKGKKCKCGKIPTFGMDKPICCTECKEPGMIDVVHKKCLCGKKIPCFGFITDEKATCCVSCKKEGMVDISSNKCKCGKKPSFGFLNQKPICCSSCKTEEMVDIIHNKCKCGTQPSFGFPTDSKPTCCFKCKIEGMVDIKSKTCPCGKRPTFGFPSDNKAICCKNCRQTGMINVKNILCKCGKIPIFGFLNEKPICCASCKTEGMVDIKSEKCPCGKHRTFGYPDDIKPICCTSCKKEGMIDIKNSKCDICKKRSHYGFPSNKPNKCAVHKEEGMIPNPRNKCRKPNCTNIAIYGIKKPLHCEEHKQAGELNLIERKCVICGRLDIVNEDGKCINFCLLGNDSEIYKIYRKNQKLKQDKVVKILTHEFGKPTRLDQVVESKCGLERPDIVYDCKTHIIVVEVDENQHKSYCEKGEYNRMKNIFFAFGGIPVVFIRYNPDTYTDCNKNKNKLSIGKREEELKRWIRYIKNYDIKIPCSAVYLFYDNYNETNKELIEINPYEK